jgi:predicted ATPase
MSRYFEAMQEVIERHGGTVEKFVGDAVMAVFGIPAVREDDPLRAVRAALEMRTEQERLNEEFERRFAVRLEVRTGINTGPVVAGDPSRGQSFATGDAVNTAARLEQAAPVDGILLGQPTYELVRDAVTVEPVEPLRAKGKSEPLQAYLLVAVKEGAAALARRLDLPLVGRDSELRGLAAVLKGAESERKLEVALLIGEAGVGKSRLAAELLARSGTRSLMGRCLHYGEGITFWPIAEIVRSASGISDADSPADAVRRIEALVGGEDARALGVAIGLAEAELSIERIFGSIRSLLEALAREEPLVLVLDDLHWAEETLLDLVDYLARASREAPILLLALARPELIEARPGWAERFTCLRLSPLGTAESERLAAELLGGPLKPELLERLVKAAEGNPLYLEELLRMLADRGVLQRRDGGWAASAELREVETPPTIEALIAARLERLGQDERAVAEAASVIGQVFWAVAVAALREREAIAPELEALLRQELVLADPERFREEAGYRFAHILIRDVAYERLLKETRARYHERFARWLEHAAAAGLVAYEEIVGYHLEQAYRYDAELGPPDARAQRLAADAAERLGSAGRRAYEREDIVGAIGLLDRAVALVASDSPRRPPLLVDLGMALTEGGEFEPADRLLSDAAELASGRGERELELRALVERAFGRASTDPAGS